MINRSLQGSVVLWVLIGALLPIWGGDILAQISSSDDRKSWQWQSRLSTGYDVFTQTYQLALQDTTETISEMEATYDGEVGSVGRRVHNWRLRPGLGLGTERNQQQLEWFYTFRPERDDPRLRFSGSSQARQYRGGTDYNLSSDTVEGRADLRWLQAIGDHSRGELKLIVSALDYTDPSLLEVNRHEAVLGAYLKSAHADARIWSVGIRRARRVYPDSSAIDRETTGLEFEYDHNDFLGPSLRVYYRGERREIADPAARPSSWGHLSSVEISAPLGEKRFVMELRNETWRYDEQWGPYTNQLRWDGSTGLRGGGLDGFGWQVLMTVEDLDSDTVDESYRQLGIRGGLEHFGDHLGGELTLEMGRRDYLKDTGEEPGLDEDYLLYSDFTYLEVWLVGSWRFNARLSLDAMVNYVPENHSQDIDNQAMGFGNLRLICRF